MLTLCMFSLSLIDVGDLTLQRDVIYGLSWHSDGF